MLLGDYCLCTVIEESILCDLRTLWSHFICINVLSLLAYQGISCCPANARFFPASDQSNLCFVLPALYCFSQMFLPVVSTEF